MVVLAEFSVSYECRCGRYHYLKDIQALWGWDSLDELTQYLDTNTLYMGCSERCMP